MGWFTNPGQMMANQERRFRETFSDTGNGVGGRAGLTHPTRNAHTLIQNTDPGYRMLNPSGGNQTKAQRLYDQGLVSSGQAYVGQWAGNNLFGGSGGGAGTSSGSSSGYGAGGMGGMGGGGGQSGPSSGTVSNMQMQQQTEELQRQQRESARNQRLAQLLRDLQNGAQNV